MENFSFEQTLFCQPHYDTLSLTENRMSWKEALEKSPMLPRGWFELAALSNEDRIEFTRLFWLSKLIYSSSQEREIDRFFSSLATIELFLVQERCSAPYIPLMLYSQKRGSTFFGARAALPQTIARTAQQFNHFPLPEDYLSFFEIHDGFHSSLDRGILSMRELASYASRIKELPSFRGEPLLFPFCELENIHQLQCFYKVGPLLPLANKQVDLLEWTTAASFANFVEWLLHYVYSR